MRYTQLLHLQVQEHGNTTETTSRPVIFTDSRSRIEQRGGVALFFFSPTFPYPRGSGVRPIMLQIRIHSVKAECYRGAAVSERGLISRISVASDKLARNLRAKISAPTLTCSRYHRRYTRAGAACRTPGKYDDFAPCITAPALAFIPISRWTREEKSVRITSPVLSTPRNRWIYRER